MKFTRQWKFTLWISGLWHRVICSGATDVSGSSRFLKKLCDIPECAVSQPDRPQPKYIPYSSSCSSIYSNDMNIKLDMEIYKISSSYRERANLTYWLGPQGYDKTKRKFNVYWSLRRLLRVSFYLYPARVLLRSNHFKMSSTSDTAGFSQILHAMSVSRIPGVEIV